MPFFINFKTSQQEPYPASRPKFVPDRTDNDEAGISEVVVKYKFMYQLIRKVIFIY